MIYKTILILCFVLYGCETLSPTLAEHRLGAFENKALRRISGPSRRNEKRAKKNPRIFVIEELLLQ
jgi:hypothetical protein